MIKTTYESKYLLINFITEYKILIFSTNSSLDKLNQMTLTRRPISSLYLLKLLKEVYNVNNETIIGVAGNYNEKGRYYSLLYGYACANNIRIRKVDFYQACERINTKYHIIDNVNKITNWYKKYFIVYNKIINKKSLSFINDNILEIFENLPKKECIIFKKTLLMLLYMHIRQSLYKNSRKCILNKKDKIFEKQITLSENNICIIE